VQILVRRHQSILREICPEIGTTSPRNSANSRKSCGSRPNVAKERLGHSQIGITLDTYSHVVPTLQLEAAGKLDAMLRSRRRPTRSWHRA
jgi:hypothetical protein